MSDQPGHYGSHGDNKTPRERFLEVQKQIKEDNQKISGTVNLDDDDDYQEDLDVARQAVDEFDDEDDAEPVDKHMGTEKHVVTREEHEQGKAQESQTEALKAIGLLQDTKLTEHLSNDQKQLLRDLANQQHRGELDDPVLKHMLLQKSMLVKGYSQVTEDIKELNKKILNELNMASNKLLKTQGAIENIDEQIIKYVEQKSEKK